MTTRVFTGYFPAFKAKHLTEDQFRSLGGKLVAATDAMEFGIGYALDSCWASRFLAENPSLKPSDRSPAPDRFETPMDMVRSNIAILQRFEWLAIAAKRHPEVDNFVWLEYTLFKQPGITEDLVKEFLRTVDEHPHDAISIPGCWPKQPIDDGAICWRFCGSAWVCPAQYAAELYHAVKHIVKLRVRATGTISWDVNTLAYLELLDLLPIRWYPGNHDATQLINYFVRPLPHA